MNPNYFKDPRNMAMMGVASELLKAGGDNPRKINISEALGRGIESGMGAYNQGRQMEVFDQQMQRTKMMQEMQQQEMLRKYQIQNMLAQRFGMGAQGIPPPPPGMPGPGDIPPDVPRVGAMPPQMGGGQLPLSLNDAAAITAMGGPNMLGFVKHADTQGLNERKFDQSNRQFGVTHGLNERKFNQSQSQFDRSQSLNELKFRLDSDLGHQAQKAYSLAAAKEQGTGQTRAASSLPGVISEAEEALRLSDELLQHPGLNVATGASSVFDPRNYAPGTEARGFNIRNEQLKGKVFMQAYESLKGAGQITENETQQAQAALARMDTSASKGEYVQAVKEFQDVIRRGVQNAKSKAGLQPSRTYDDGWGEVIAE